MNKTILKNLEDDELTELRKNTCELQSPDKKRSITIQTFDKSSQNSTNASISSNLRKCDLLNENTFEFSYECWCFSKEEFLDVYGKNSVFLEEINKLKDFGVDTWVMMRYFERENVEDSFVPSKLDPRNPSYTKIQGDPVSKEEAQKIQENESIQDQKK